MRYFTIIQIEAEENNYHPVQSQSHRTECWLDGYIAVPDELTEIVWENQGYGNLKIEDGVLVGFTPTEKPEPMPEPTAQEDTDAMLIDHEYRLTMLELGLTE